MVYFSVMQNNAYRFGLMWLYAFAGTRGVAFS